MCALRGAPASMCVRHYARLLVPLCLALAVRAAARCASILPYYQVKGGARIHTETLFEFVDALPNARGKEESRALVAVTRERCGLVREMDALETTKRFRKACYKMKHALAQSRAPPPSMDEATSMDEAAVRAALNIANIALRRAWQSCDVMCPCFNNGKVCPTVPDGNGDCVVHKVEPIENKPALVSMEVLELSPEPIDVMITATVEPEPELPSMTPEPSLLVDTDAVVVVFHVTPEPSTDVPLVQASIQSTPKPSSVTENKEVAAAPSTSTTSDKSSSKKSETTPAPLSDAETQLVGKQPLSVGAIAGIGVAAVVAVVVVAGFAMSQVAFRRRHSEEIDQWRQAFRVVED